jgi:hypothetical protein
MPRKQDLERITEIVVIQLVIADAVERTGAVGVTMK